MGISPWSDVGRVKADLERELHDKASKRDFYGLTSGLDKAEQRISSLEGEVETLKQRLQWAEEETGRVRSYVDDSADDLRSDLEKLARRVGGLEP